MEQLLICSKYKNSGLPKSVAQKLIEDLDLLMEREKIYRESNLNMWMLVDKLNSNYHFVSQTINQYLNVNFFEYLNRKRVEEAKRLLLSSGNLKVIEIAYLVGYSTKNTFNNAFKRLTGYTPTEYRLKFNHTASTPIT